MRGLVVFVLVAVLSFASSSMAASSDKPRATTRPTQRQVARSIRGVIASMDIEARTLTITVDARRQEGEKQVTVETDANTEFLLDGEPVDLVDLRPGMRASFQPESGVAQRISARTK